MENLKIRIFTKLIDEAATLNRYLCSMKRTEISEIGGEFALIDRIAASTNISLPETIKGIGDDAAVINSGEFYTVISTDMLLEGVHFDLSYVPLRHLGYKAVAVNISDISAMNAVPKQITVSIALSNRIPVEAIDELYEGIRAACEAYRIDLVGGDTTNSRSGLVISVTAVGTAAKDHVTYRSGAKPNDILCVTGSLGAAYLGLQVLEREKQVFLADPNMQPQLDKYEYVVGKQLKPEARTDIIYDFIEGGIIPTSMIDISDGLASEILHLCKASGVGIRVFEENIPIENPAMLTATEFNLNPITVAMNGGEDYELLMTISPPDFEKVKNLSEITPIGFVTEEKGAFLVLNSGQLTPIKAQGWEHFDSEK